MVSQENNSSKFEKASHIYWTYYSNNLQTDFLHQPFHCKLSSGSFERDDVNQGGGVATGGNTGSDAKPSLQPM